MHESMGVHFPFNIVNLRGPQTCTSDKAVMSLADPVIDISLVDESLSQYKSVYESAEAVTGYLIIQSDGESLVEFFSCILNLLIGSKPVHIMNKNTLVVYSKMEA